MAWLKGQATQATIVDKLTKLAVGEVADDTGLTVPLADRWLRHTAGQDAIVTPASKKVALPSMTFRAGYLSLSPSHGALHDRVRGNWCRVSNVFTSAPGGATRWVMYWYVTTSNSVAGDYSTARVAVMINNADSGANLYWSTSLAPSAAGVLTVTNGLQLTMGNSENGILNNYQSDTSLKRGFFMRFFSTTYMGGIDFWPMEHRRQPGEASVFGTPPPGTETTDWVRDVRMNTVRTGFYSNTPNWGTAYRGGLGQGLGIKTNAGLTGAQYTVTFNVYPMGMRMHYNGTQYIQNDLACGWSSRDATAVFARIHGTTATAWIRMFTGAPLSSSVVQYWMCVKADRIIIVLNGDPGVGGILSVNGVWEFTSVAPSEDLFPWAMGGNQIQYISDHSSNDDAFMPVRQWSLATMRSIVSGYGLPTGRDYQLGWGRSDILLSPDAGNGDGSAADGVDNTLGDPGDGPTNDGSGQGMAMDWMNGMSRTSGVFHPYYGVPGMLGHWSNNNDSRENENQPIFRPYVDKPDPIDNKWWLYGFPYTDSPGSSFAPQNTTTPTWMYRGYQKDKFVFIPESGYSSGDELTDTDTSDVYFLIRPDYAGSGMGRVRVGSNLWYGGIAIKEAP